MSFNQIYIEFFVERESDPVHPPMASWVPGRLNHQSPSMLSIAVCINIFNIFCIIIKVTYI